MFAPQTRETADRKQEAKEEQGNKPWGAAVTALRLNHKSTQEIKGLRGRSNFRPPALSKLNLETVLGRLSNKGPIGTCTTLRQSMVWVTEHVASTMRN